MESRDIRKIGVDTITNTSRMARTIWVAGLLSLLRLVSAQDIAPSNTTVTGSDNNGTEVGIFHGSTYVSRYPVSPLKNGTTIPVCNTSYSWRIDSVTRC